MTDLLLKKTKKTLINKEGREIEIDVYYVVVNDIEIVLKPNDYTSKAILDKYYKDNNK